jgi:hypothetical protein
MNFNVKEVGAPTTKGSVALESELIKTAETSTAETVNTDTETKEQKASVQAGIELNDEKVVEYLSKRSNRPITSLDELKFEAEPQELPEDVSAFLKYKKETGRGIEDFVKLNKDFESEPEDSLIKGYLLETQKGLDAEDIDILMDDYSYDEDLDDETQIGKVKIARKKILMEAKNFFNSQKEKYKVPVESAGGGLSEKELEDYKAYKQYISQASTVEEENSRKRQWFSQKTDELFTDEFKGFEFEVGEDAKKIIFTPASPVELKTLQSNPQNFIQKFLDEKGMIKDVTGYHKSLSVAMNPEKFAKHFYEQGRADAIVNLDKESKNINMTTRRAPEVSKGHSGIQVRAVNPDSGSGLRIRTKN